MYQKLRVKTVSLFNYWSETKYL